MTVPCIQYQHDDVERLLCSWYQKMNTRQFRLNFVYLLFHTFMHHLKHIGKAISTFCIKNVQTSQTPDRVYRQRFQANRIYRHSGSKRTTSTDIAVPNEPRLRHSGSERNHIYANTRCKWKELKSKAMSHSSPTHHGTQTHIAATNDTDDNSHASHV